MLGPGPDGGPRHSTALLVEVERAAAAAGGWGQVGRIGVGRGPGSFVGVRIAIATALGLSTSTGIALAGVCTLDALGRALAERLNGPGAGGGEGEAAGGAGLAVLDARRGEVFAALYSAAGERLWEPAVHAPAALAERAGALGPPPLAAGSGAVRFRNEMANRGLAVPGDADPLHRVSGRHLCALAEAAAGGDGGHLDPIYLRPPDAQRWRERDTSQRAE